MPKASVFNASGEKLSDMELSDGVFGVKPNVSAMRLCVIAYLANRRRGTQSTLTRAEVSGGGKKPWRQKGTGRARQGSTRAPQWRHGGVAFGPKPRDYHKDVNKKVRRLAMKSAFSAKLADSELIVLDDLVLEEIKTKEMAKTVAALNVGKKILFVLPESNGTIYLSARNLPGVKTSPVGALNVYDLLNCDCVVVLKDAVSKIEEVYA